MASEIVATQALPGKALGIAYQIPRNSLALLMVAQVVVILPLAAHISLWIVGAALFAVFGVRRCIWGGVVIRQIGSRQF